VEFSPQSDILQGACMCPAGLGLYGKGKCNHIGGLLFVIEDFTRRGLQKHAKPLSCTSWLSVWVVPRNQSVAAKPLDQVLIRKILVFSQRWRQCGQVVRALDLKSGGRAFKSRSDHFTGVVSR